jgi:biopolymer transport protein ExbB
MNQAMGLAHFWAQGDAVIHGVAIVLLTMSVASWTIILGKAVSHLRFRLSIDRALNAFWNAETRMMALEAIRREDRSGAFAHVAIDAMAAAEAYEQHAAKGIGAGVGSGEFIARTLQQSLVLAQARIERGLTVLASVGSTAPFVGLFGTVWGIYHALISLAGATQVVLDKVAGPVGEALIMTAAGLFVAVPAVLAYNACNRANRVVLARLEGFAHSVHAYLVSGVRVGAGARPAGITSLRVARKD